ncbi:T9SS type A sorting domain-containing protein [Labilibacter sediminis]|nr:T9SS type A sorting domain-containing protein [Labilibacter sediminis]
MPIVVSNYLKYILLLCLTWVNAAYSQEIFKLNITQSPLLNITLPEVLDVTIGQSVNLDTVYTIDGELAYNSHLEFWDGEHTHTLENPIYTVVSDGSFYLTIIDENGCTFNDTISLQNATHIDGNLEQSNTQPNIRIYPSPCYGTFTVSLIGCQSDYSIHIFNSLGIKVLNRMLECAGDKFSGLFTIQPYRPGIYFIQIKQNKRTVHVSKIVIL